MRNKIKFPVAVFTLLLLLVPSILFAQFGGGGGSNSGSLFGGGGGSNTLGPTIQNPLGGVSTIPQFIAKVLQVVTQLGVPVIILFLIYCGFLFVRAQGNTDRLKEAKDALIYTLIGSAIFLGATVLATVINNTIRAIMH